MDTIRFYIKIRLTQHELNGFKKRYKFKKLYYYYKHKDITYIYRKDIHLLYIIINVRQIINDNELTKVNYIKLCRTINKNLIFNLDIENIELSRVDYKKDIRFKNENIKKIYMNILTRSKDYYRHLKKNKIYDNTEKGITIYYNNKSTCLCIYDKYVESNDKRYINTIRLEIRLLRQYILRQYKQHGIKPILFNYFCKYMRAEVIEKYIINILGRENYYSLKEAKKIINSNCRNDLVKNLIEYLRYYNKYNKRKAQSKYKSFVYYNKKLKELNININLIPEKYNIKYLSNIFNL